VVKKEAQLVEQSAFELKFKGSKPVGEKVKHTSIVKNSRVFYLSIDGRLKK
jgi:hypothetical protein